MLTACKHLACHLIPSVKRSLAQMDFEEAEKRRAEEAAARPAEPKSGFLSFGRLAQLGRYPSPVRSRLSVPDVEQLERAAGNPA